MRKFIADQQIAFDPDLIERMVIAFNDAWKLATASQPLQKVDGDAIELNAIPAKRIISQAAKGERNPARLCADALEHLAAARSNH